VVDRYAFGAQLRRVRLREGVSLDAIAAATNMPVTVWESLEDGELYGWPSGLLARSMVRDYARLIRLDPDDTINQFCRLFPNGDRRRSSQLDALATLINHPADGTDDRPATVERRAVALVMRRERADIRRRRTIDVVIIAATITGAIFAAHALTHLPLAICAATAGAAGVVAAAPIRRLIARRAAGRRARQAVHAAWWKRFGRGIGAHP